MVLPVRGQVMLDPRLEDATVLARLEAGLRALGCTVVAGEGRLLLSSGSRDRYSPLAFVDGGPVWLERSGVADQAHELRLHYAMSTRNGFYLCLGLSAFMGTAAWFTFGDPWLTGFGYVAPVAWLYGANYVMSLVRVPGTLRRLAITPTP